MTEHELFAAALKLTGDQRSNFLGAACAEDARLRENVAALQRAQACPAEERPVLIRIETHGSHGYRPTDKRIAELADQWAFTAAQMGMR